MKSQGLIKVAIALAVPAAHRARCRQGASLVCWRWTVLLAGLCAMPAAAAVGQAPEGMIERHACATATCHGAVAERGPAWRSAAEVWQTQDPHAQSYRTLWNERSRRMVEMLDPAAARSDEAYAGLLAARCVSCHATVPNGYAGQEILPASWLAGGVGCQACHGAATAWIDAHVRADWLALGDERYGQRYRMRPTESIDQRAEGCLRCHLGSRSADGVVRDMNHDLIAAGHPVLHFEFHSYWSGLPAHWDPHADAARQHGPAWRFPAYQAGRRAGLQAAIRLSGERARDALKDPSLPWPEFAEYDCFACHQSLDLSDSYAAFEAGQDRALGRPEWNRWHLAGLELTSAPAVRRYARRMTDQWLRPSRAAELAAAALEELGDLPADRLSPSGADPGATWRAAMASAPTTARWQEAAQWFLGTSAALEDLLAWKSQADSEANAETAADAGRPPAAVASTPAGGFPADPQPARDADDDAWLRLTARPGEFHPAHMQHLQRYFRQRLGDASLDSSSASGETQP